ncbi:hypothetical protein SJT38_13495 [Aeromonas caviae]|uniref:hypothetical protein n=1 Tax=Aeromonas caviae TaxID=648 RepID=UPI0029DE3F39|nr:hypothetical protein [Aeromonas caviae]MDX7824113.1 hypothetical protein [Aeromonas caviae]
MRLIGWGALIIIMIVLGLYYYQFGAGPTTLSDEKDVWGQFGDYFGGTLNPILSFMSVLLLIKSVRLQLVANSSLIKETKRQEYLDKRKSFEFQFYNLIEAQKSGFDDFSLKFPSPSGFVTKNKVEAVNELESLIKKGRGGSINLPEVLEALDNSSDDKIFSCARRLYLIVKLINDKVTVENGFDDKDKLMYVETLVNLSDFATIRLICIIITYLSWPNIMYVKNTTEINSVIDSTGLNIYIASLK